MANYSLNKKVFLLPTIPDKFEDTAEIYTVLKSLLQVIGDIMRAIQPIESCVTVLSTHTDNAAAITAGLVAGQLYKTSTGTVMIVY